MDFLIDDMVPFLCILYVPEGQFFRQNSSTIANFENIFFFLNLVFKLAHR